MGWERKRVGNREGKETTNIYLLSALSLFLTILLWFMVGCGAFDRLRRNLFFRRHRWNSSNFSDHDTQTLAVYLKWSHLWKHRTGGLISAASQSSISSGPWANAAARFSEAAFKLPPLRISHRPRVHNNELRLATWFSDEGFGLLIDDWTRCGKKSGKVRAGRCVHGKEGMRRKKWSEWLLRRQRPCCPGPDSTLYIRCPPPSLPSELLIQFHPHEGISSTAPSLIYPSIHLSLPQQMGKITRNNATTNSPPSLLLAILHSNLTSSEVGPSGGKRYVWITQRMRAVGFWCQRIGHSADVGFGVGWFCITID